jgi:CRP/FNR family transcriptional regulator, cyclic AMP receptor protein
MQPTRFKAGEIIFRAGEPSIAVYVISEGEVSISVDDGFEVTRLHAGDLFGESGVLESRPRAATAIALKDTTVLVTDAETFVQAFGMTDPRTLTLVKLLCRRLRDTSVRAAHADGHPPIAGTLACPIQLLPEDDVLTHRFRLAPVDVTHLPFQVGNRFGGEEGPIASNRSCVVPAHGDTDLSAPHFEIVRRDGRIGIHDMGSRTGTIVNGITIGRAVQQAFLALHPGDNHVVAGRMGSPYRFCVRYRGV